MAIPTVSGKNGFRMPLVGFGTWQATEEVLEAALNAALEAGYRHIDTAYAYQNEHVIGRVLQEWISEGKLKREDLFIVTKLPAMGNRAEDVEKFIDLSLSALQLDYVDLYLIHTPFGFNYRSDDNMFPFLENGNVDVDLSTDLIAIWKAMEEQVEKGKTKWIGVSNFNKQQVERILDAATIPPAANQIQLNIYMQQPDLVSYLQENDIVVTSYSTLGTPATIHFLKACGSEKTELPSCLRNEVVVKIAKEVGRSPAQVLLKHMTQRNIVVIPKSVTADRIQQNISLFDFTLSNAHLKKLNALNEDVGVLDFKDCFKGVEAHPEYPY